MLQARWLQQLHLYLLCAVAFSIPLPFIFGSIAMLLLIATWLLTANFKEVFRNLAERKVLWFWILYFLLHAISYFYSANKAQSLFDIQSKLSFLLLPIVIGTSSTISRSFLEKIFLSFVSGITLVAIITVSRGLFLWLETGNPGTLFYHELVDGFDSNAIYEAWYTIFSLCILLFVKWRTYFQGRYNNIKILLTVFQITFFILLSPRMLLILFFVVIVPIYLSQILNKFRTSKLILIISSLVLLFVLFINTDNPIKERYKNIFQIDVSQAYLQNYKGIPEGDFSNLTLRLFLWRLGMENMNEQHLWLTGAGNGDVSKLQNDKMHEYGINIYPTVEEHHSPFFNANLHNMYLQSLIMLGIGGLILILCITFAPFILIRNITNIFVIFSITAVLFMLQEAALQSQAGIIYYTFFTNVLWAFYYNKNNIMFKLNKK